MGKTARCFQVQPANLALRMNRENDSSDLPLYDAGEQTAYSLEVVARLTGVSSQTILHYQEHGLLKPAQRGDFDDEAVHTLRRIEHLRQACETNLTGLKLILDLMDQVERLKLQLRQ